MVYAESEDELVMACRRLWRFSLTSGQWVYRRLTRDQASSYMDGEDGIATYDEARHELLVSSAGSSGVYRATGYSLTNQTWTDWSSHQKSV